MKVPSLAGHPAALTRGARVIVFEDIALTMFIGVYPAEREQPQRVRISVELLVVPALAEPNDRLADVLDYSRVHASIRAIAGGPHIGLQETLAERIAGACLGEADVAAVMVYVRKLDAYPDCESVGICILRQRDGAAARPAGAE